MYIVQGQVLLKFSCVGAWPLFGSVDTGPLAADLSTVNPCREPCVTPRHASMPPEVSSKGQKNTCFHSSSCAKLSLSRTKKAPCLPAAEVELQFHVATLWVCDSSLLVFHNQHKMMQGEARIASARPAWRSTRVFPNRQAAAIMRNGHINEPGGGGKATQEESVLCRARFCNFECP